MKKSQSLSVVVLCVFALLLTTAFGEFRYRSGVSEGYERGKQARYAAARSTDESNHGEETLQGTSNTLSTLTKSASAEKRADTPYNGPEACMLSPADKAPLWTERTTEEALALEVSDNVDVELQRLYASRDLDASVPLTADESFMLNLVVHDMLVEGSLHVVNCYYPKHIAAGESADVRIMLEEENGEVYVGTIRLTAGDEDLNLVHGAANPDSWYGAHTIDCDEDDGIFSVYFYTGATEAHWERPMIHDSSGASGTVRCNYHRLENATT